MIDIAFDFRSDSNGKDPDSFSATLNKYHQSLWSKELPNGEVMELRREGPPFTLIWKEIVLSSDSIIVELKFEKNKRIIDQVYEIIDDADAYYENLLRRSYSIGGMIVFPKHVNSMNQRRGTTVSISDRWDLTLECIRRYYIEEDSPLYEVIKTDKAFFDLFVDFKGYVDFFLLQDCVS